MTNYNMYRGGDTLSVSVFASFFDTVYKDRFRVIFDRIKNAIVTYSNSVTFFLSKFPAGVWARVVGQRIDCIVDFMSMRERNLLRFLFCFFANNYSAIQGVSHFFLNSSYGVKSLVSNSAFKRSLSSSRSSTSSTKDSYSCKSIRTAVFCPFSSIINCGCSLFKFYLSPYISIIVMSDKTKVKGIGVKGCLAK